MTNKKIKRMLDACYQAKRIREMLPPLPEGIMSSHIRYMDMIQELQKQNDHVRVSDLSDVLNIPRPGVTRTIKEMEKKGLVQKISSPDDGRVTYLSLTEHGKELSEKYNENYFNELLPYLDAISDTETDCMIRTIQKFYDIQSFPSWFLRKKRSSGQDSISVVWDCTRHILPRIRSENQKKSERNIWLHTATIMISGSSTRPMM